MRKSAAADSPTRPRFWLADLDFRDGALWVKKTGQRLPLTGEFIGDVSAWLVFFAAFLADQARAPRRRAFTVAFVPDKARPWYLVWPVLQGAGARFVEDPSIADLVFHFDDATYSHTPPPPHKPGAALINFACRDVSKTRVADAFHEAFGYPLKLDPERHNGPAVEKTEENGKHTGRIVQCPMRPAPGRTYQRLIDNRIGRGLVEDLRTPTLAGRALCVFLKRRSVDTRFANANAECALKMPGEVFRDAELEAIARFTRLLGLDWGGLDVLRDASDGRIYVVDANKTDMGPPLALPLGDKMRAIRLLAEGVRAHVLAHVLATTR